ncbi:MAG: AzlC family ABC transporter permease [Ornithinimicrobium sp.]
MSEPVRRGLRAALPLAVTALPFGLVYGLVVVNSSVSPWVGLAGSWLILAGAAQISLVELIDAGAAWPVAVGTALVINSRLALYSAALAPAFAGFDRRWRWSLPYLLTDQAAVVAITEFTRRRDPWERRTFFAAAGLLIAVFWWVGSIIGVLAGGSIPEEVDIGFAVPAMFLALLVPSLTNRPVVVAAVTGGVTSVAAAGLPSGVNITVAALAGIAAGRLVPTSRPIQREEP